MSLGQVLLNTNSVMTTQKFCLTLKWRLYEEIGEMTRIGDGLREANPGLHIAQS